MKLDKTELNDLQSQHLDALIRLAYRYEEAADVQAALAEYAAQPPTAGDVAEPQRQATFDRAMAALDAKAAATRSRTHRLLTRFAEVAAVILLLLAVAAPIAVANIDVLRNAFGRLFFSGAASPDDLSVYYRPTLPTDFAYQRPGMTWTGLYLPAGVPAGYISEGCMPIGDGCYLTLRHEGSGDLLRFAEQLDAPQPLPGGKVLRWVSLGDGAACVEQAENGDLVVTWHAHERWYRLRSTQLTQEELLAIAGSLVPYAGEDVMGTLQAQSVAGAAIPQGYAGQFFPTWTPEGFTCTEVSDMSGMYFADFQAGDGRTWLWTEAAGDSSMLDGNGGEPVYVEIGSAAGAMYTDGEYITLIWMNELRMFHLKGRGMTQEEMLCIARSVGMIDRSTAQESLPVVSPTPTATPAPAMTLAHWPMPYVPTWCPEGCFEPYAYRMSDFGASLCYVFEDGTEIVLTVNRSEIAIFDNTEYLLGTPVDVNGSQARLTFSPLGGGGIDLHWQADGYYFYLRGAAGHEADLVKLARSLRPGRPEEIAVTAQQSACQPEAPTAELLHYFPAALLTEYEVYSGHSVLDSMTRLTLGHADTGAIVHLVQLDPQTELLVAGGPDFNVSQAQLEISGRQVTVYTPTEDSASWAPTALMWHEGGYQYMLLSTQPHAELYAILSTMIPATGDGRLSTPAPVPAATPVAQSVPDVWAGEHFITCVPGGYALVSVTADRVLWRNEQGESFAFLKMPEDWSVAGEAAGAQEVFVSSFRGRWCMEVLRFDEETFDFLCRCIFSVDGQWYALEGDYSWLFYANYVQKIK